MDANIHYSKYNMYERERGCNAPSRGAPGAPGAANAHTRLRALDREPREVEMDGRLAVLLDGIDTAVSRRPATTPLPGQCR